MVLLLLIITYHNLFIPNENVAIITLNCFNCLISQEVQLFQYSNFPNSNVYKFLHMSNKESKKCACPNNNLSTGWNVKRSNFRPLVLILSGKPTKKLTVLKSQIGLSSLCFLYKLPLTLGISLTNENDLWCDLLKGAPSGLRQFLAIESPLEMMKNPFYFSSKTLFILKIFNFLFWLVGHVTKQLD